jgi:predicted nucleic acid-binding protein
VDADNWGKTHYLDASALVKLVADDPDEEPGRAALRKYYWGHTDSVYATSYCVTETFSAFKRKSQQHRITEDQYIKYVLDFCRLILGLNLRIDEVPILAPVVSTEAERLIKKHKIDFLDCFQIVTILHGRFPKLGPNSQSILITADRDLATAARAEGARVWECTSEPAPNQVALTAAGLI